MPRFAVAIGTASAQKGVRRMRNFAILIALTLLAACGGGSPGVPAVGSAGASAANPAGGGGKHYDGTVFVSDPDNLTVWICPANFHDVRRGFLNPTGQLQGVSFPVQMAVDAQGTLYVANAQVDSTGGGSITEYPRGATSPSRTLTTGLNTSTGVAVDSSGNVYVSNKYAGSIVVFAKGKMTPKETITANLTGPDGLAVDAAGDLYIADSSANDILKLTHGSKTPQPLHLKNIARPTGVALDTRGNLYVSNLLAQSSNVTVYAPGSTTPKATIVVPGPPTASESTIAEPMMLSVTKPGNMLMVGAPISLTLVGGEEWFGYYAGVVGYAAGQKQPAWTNFTDNANDAVFQPAK
jgi:hypothetical protein